MESAISRVEGKNQKDIDVKVDRVMRKWLDMPLQFRDPVKAGVAPAIPTRREEV